MKILNFRSIILNAKLIKCEQKMFTGTDLKVSLCYHVLSDEFIEQKLLYSTISALC